MNCYVRVNTGDLNGIPVYVMAEIVSIKYGFKQYRIDDKFTDIRIDLAIGNNLKRFRANLISNSRFTQAEFDLYVSRMRAVPKKLISLKVINYLKLYFLPLFFFSFFFQEAYEKRQILRSFVNHKYTDEEVRRMIIKKRGKKIVSLKLFFLQNNDQVIVKQ
jgi:hypothetical protein